MTTNNTSTVRINKYLAHAGLASRREADTLIRQGEVLVNGKLAEIGQMVTGTDTVELKRKQQKEYIYLAYYKGRGVITHSPAAGETDIATKIEQQYKLSGVFPIGRLDKDSEGLLILSNDGRITGPLLDPDSGHEKEYEVQVDKNLTGTFIKSMRDGVQIEKYKTKPAKLEKKTNQRFLLTLTEGKKHQIRRMCAALGYQVQSLKRVRILNITLGELKPNQYRKLTAAETTEFLKTLGVMKL